MRVDVVARLSLQTILAGGMARGNSVKVDETLDLVHEKSILRAVSVKARLTILILFGCSSGNIKSAIVMESIPNLQ